MKLNARPKSRRVRQKLAPVFAGGKLWVKLVRELRINSYIDRMNARAIARREISRLRREANKAALG